ncbi:MAG: MFS transporter [Micrococcales bacterium]|nr:MFS transporter [Micrococcales bacterium]
MVQTQWFKLQVLSAASGISFLGSAMTTFAVVLRDKNAAGAPGVSLLFLCMLLPAVFLSPWAGLLADRYSTRKIMPPLLMIMSLSSFSLALGLPSWWSYIALLISASANTGVNASFNALIPSLAAKEDVTRANGMNTTYTALGSLLAPALGGILVSTTGYFWPFIIDGVSFIVLTVVILMLKVDRKGKFVFQDKLIRSIVILITVLIVSLGVIQVGEVFLLIDELHATTLIYGLVGAVFAFGAVSGGVFTLLAKIPLRYHMRIVTVAILMVIVVVITIARAHHWWVVMTFGYLGGICMALLNSYGTGIIQNRTEESVRARVMATFGAIITVGTVTSTALAGIAIEAFGVRNTFVGAGVIGAVILAVLGPAVLKHGKDYGREETKA